MTEHYEVAISVIGAAQNHFAREGGTYCVARLGLDVGTAMPACTAKVAYYLASRERVAPLLVGEVDGELPRLLKGVLGSCHPHHLPFVNIHVILMHLVVLLRKAGCREGHEQ